MSAAAGGEEVDLLDLAPAPAAAAGVAEGPVSVLRQDHGLLLFLLLLVLLLLWHQVHGWIGGDIKPENGEDEKVIYNFVACGRTSYKAREERERKRR